jgi:hypothetical protein
VSHDIVEDDEFTTPITVPDGTDSRNDAAEVVEAIAQALGNRTFSLLTHSAFHDSANHFTASNVFDELIAATLGITVANPNAGEAAVTLTTSAIDDLAVGNKWKNFLEAAVANAAMNVNVWTGNDTGGESHVAITLNVYWDAATQMWNQSNAAHASFAILLHADAKIAALVAKPAASAPWALWSTPGGTTLRAAHGNFDDVVSAGQITIATGGLEVTSGGVEVQGSSDISVDSGEFLFATPRNEPRPIRLAMGLDCSLLAPNPATFLNHQWVMPDTSVVEVPIEAPIGGTLHITEAILGNTSGGNLTYTVRLVQIQNANWTTGAGPTYNTVATTTAVINNGTNVVVSLDWGGLVVNVNHTHVLQFEAAAGAAGAFVVRAARFFADRVGPSRN